METRAHFIIVGLFTVFGILGGLGFVLWLTSVQVDRQYAQYGVLFENVSGLDQSADVLFNGVAVGQVTDIRIWEEDPSQAYVAIDIDATTPVATDTIARLESQGVTGVAYIALSGGLPGTPALTDGSDGPPIIQSRQSSFQTLMTDAPDLLEDTAKIFGQLEQLTGPENQDHVRSILENVDNATAGLDQALTDFSDISETLRSATDKVTLFVEGFVGVGAASRTTLTAADESFATITQTFENADLAIQEMNTAIAAINDVISDDIAPLAGDLRNTLASADLAFASVDRIFASDLGAALSDAQSALDGLSDTLAAINTDGPIIMRDLRAGVADARTAVRTFNYMLRRMSQNPSEFLLDDRVPEYRR